MASLFTVDWEDIWDGVNEDGPSRVEEPTLFLLDLLSKYEVRAIFYVLGKTRDRNFKVYQQILKRNHVIKSHGYHHVRYEHADRKPYENLGFTGGFYFRALPYFMIRNQVIKNRHFYIHPHDIDGNHPKLSNSLLNWKRHIGLKHSRSKLDRLLSEVEWYEPSQN